MQPYPTVVTVTKLQAASSQLETAIKLYFEYGDPVSIHALCSNAYDVIHALNKKRNDPLEANDMMLKDFDRFLSSKADKKLFHASLNAAQNFFKHGNSDVNSTVTLDTRYTEVHMYEAVHKYGRLVGQCPATMAIYMVWFATLYPGLLESIEIPDSVRENMKRTIPSDRTRFYAEFLPTAKPFSVR
jgi:hypothetical protein